MLKESISQFKKGFFLLVLFLPLTGIIYPLIVTVFAQIIFPYQANGSLVKKNNRLIGSFLIGQSFSSPAYFWGRPSATTPYPYNGQSSSGSNLSPSNPALITVVKERIKRLNQFDEAHHKKIPIDLVTASGSGLDPEISPFAAYYQAERIAKARNIPENIVIQLIEKHIQGRQFGFLGEPRVNVLELNLALDNIRTANGKRTTGS